MIQLHKSVGTERDEVAAELRAAHMRCVWKLRRMWPDLNDRGRMLLSRAAFALLIDARETEAGW